VNPRPENDSSEKLPAPSTHDGVAIPPGNGMTSPSEDRGGGALAAMPKIVKFDALARCGDEIWIENEGQIYRLRKTRQGKLILTK
jgi:hemin uptake protein HemP